MTGGGGGSGECGDWKTFSNQIDSNSFSFFVPLR